MKPLILAAAVLSFPGPPAFEQHFSPIENLEAIDVSLIDGAGETIDMAAYLITDYAVQDALRNAVARGVRTPVRRALRGRRRATKRARSVPPPKELLRRRPYAPLRRGQLLALRPHGTSE
jgi:phosphatidylserine/phosphatidylglycerophosphate/cardiolipin synthase-like enzyme